jgi:putative addiction module killer protein
MDSVTEALRAERVATCGEAADGHLLGLAPGLIDRVAVEANQTVSYSRHMIELVQTVEFETWMEKLRDVRGRARIIRRLDPLTEGNPGDVRPIGKGLSELRLDVGPGYRIYFVQDGDTLILLLCGGNKSTQQKDIEKEHELAERWRADKKQEEGKQ